MKKADVVVGQTYIVKVSGKEARVRLDVVHPHGGWFGTNLATGRQVRVRTAAKLRRPAVAQLAVDLVLDDELECLQCGGPAFGLGQLGNTFHFRCRNCGWQTSRSACSDDAEGVSADHGPGHQERGARREAYASGEGEAAMIKQFTKAEFLTEFGGGVGAGTEGEAQAAARDLAERFRPALQTYPDAVGVVLFRNQDFWASEQGAQQAMVVGPSNTYKSAADCEGKWLNDLPSQRQYPIGWIARADLEAP